MVLRVSSAATARERGAQVSDLTGAGNRERDDGPGSDSPRGGSPSTRGGRLSAQEHEVVELREQARQLEEELVSLRRRMQDAPKRVRTLEEKLLETKGQLQQAISQNERLTFTLREAREHIAALREEVDKLTQPPAAYGTFLARNDDGTVDVFSGGRKMRVALHPELADETDELQRGAEVVLNESLNVVLARSGERSGDVV